MKVLYLAPTRKAADRISAYTFIDEELEALALAGVQAYALSLDADREHTVRGVRIIPVARDRSSFGRLRPLRHLARGFRPPRDLLRSFRTCYRGAQIEAAAIDVVRAEGIHVIHSHFGWPSGFGGAYAHRATGRPLVASFRGMDLIVDREIGYGLRQDPTFDRSVRDLLRSADVTTYVSDHLRALGVRLGARANRATTIRKGVDIDRFHVVPDRAALRERLGLERGPMVLTVAGLIRRKGVDHLLHAVARLRDEFPVTLVVCGSGRDRPNLERLAMELDLGTRVRFVGRVSRTEIPAYFAACDVFVLASLQEAAGNVLLEAMASGRAVVTTASGGPAEYVADGATGFVVPPADPDALAERIRTLLADPYLADRMGAEGRVRAERCFRYSIMIENILGIYERITGAPDRSGHGAEVTPAPARPDSLAPRP